MSYLQQEISDLAEKSNKSDNLKLSLYLQSLNKPRRSVVTAGKSLVKEALNDFSPVDLEVSEIVDRVEKELEELPQLAASVVILVNVEAEQLEDLIEFQTTLPFEVFADQSHLGTNYQLLSLKDIAQRGAETLIVTIDDDESNLVDVRAHAKEHIQTIDNEMFRLGAPEYMEGIGFGPRAGSPQTYTQTGTDKAITEHQDKEFLAKVIEHLKDFLDQVDDDYQNLIIYMSKRFERHNEDLHDFLKDIQLNWQVNIAIPPEQDLLDNVEKRVIEVNQREFDFGLADLEDAPEVYEQELQSILEKSEMGNIYQLFVSKSLLGNNADTDFVDSVSFVANKLQLIESSEVMIGDKDGSAAVAKLRYNPETPPSTKPESTEEV